MTIDLKSISADLARLRSAKPQPVVFGAQHHRFQLNPPLPEPTVQAFENEYGIVLPADYRQFIIELGDGGAGPAYGVFRLGVMDRFHEKEILQNLSKPFPHTGPWNDFSGMPTDPSEEGFQEKFGAFENWYFSPEHVTGAFPICTYGCTIYAWLIVTGPEAGNIWLEDRGADNGLIPMSSDESDRLTFYQWYREWLDEAVRQLGEISDRSSESKL